MSPGMLCPQEARSAARGQGPTERSSQRWPVPAPRPLGHGQKLAEAASRKVRLQTPLFPDHQSTFQMEISALHPHAWGEADFTIRRLMDRPLSLPVSLISLPDQCLPILHLRAWHGARPP